VGRISASLDASSATLGTHKMQDEIVRNIPGHPDWVGSFYERLSEYGEWNENKYQNLLAILIELAENNKGQQNIDRELIKTLLILLIKVLNLISSHFDSNDVFKISNLSTDEILNKKEKFEIAVISIAS